MDELGEWVLFQVVSGLRVVAVDAMGFQVLEEVGLTAMVGGLVGDNVDDETCGMVVTSAQMTVGGMVNARGAGIIVALVGQDGWGPLNASGAKTGLEPTCGRFFGDGDRHGS